MLKDLHAIGNVYSHMINESPDNITYGDDYLHYDDKGKSIFTGLINTSGDYVVSKSIVGHGNLTYFIKAEMDDTNQDSIITNLVDDHLIKGMAREYEKVRLWRGQKVMSFWKFSGPLYNAAVFGAIKAVGGDPSDWKYDLCETDYEDFLTYEEFINIPWGDEEVARAKQKAVDARTAERMLADKLAGVNRSKVPSADYDRPVKRPYWMDNPTW